jgi:hypothetical protein
VTSPARELEQLLAGATWWGLELETGFRVLAATVEVPADQHPDGPDVADRRLQVLLHPVARVAALLTRTADEGRLTIEQFDEAQLPLVVDRLDGPVPDELVVDGPPPEPDRWAPALSMEGASNAPDGRRHHLEVAMSGADGRRLRLAVWFDEAELRRPDGSRLEPS